MSDWKPRDVILCALAIGWVIATAKTVWSGGTPPAPPPALILPAGSDPRLAYWVDQTRPPSGVDGRQLVPPPAPLEPRMTRADGIGASAVIPASDRCYQKACEVLSLVSTGAVTVGGTLTANGDFVVGGGVRVLAASPNVIRNSTSSTYINMANGGSGIEIGVGAAVRITGVGSELTVDNSITAGTYFLSTGAALTTGAACSPNKALEWDTGSSCYKFCSTNWSGCLLSTSSASAINYTFDGVCFGTCGEDVNFTGAMKNIGGTISRATCSWATAGVGGATGVVVQFYNVTGAAEVCSCTLGACTTAANSPLDCGCAAALTGTNAHAFRLKNTTDCGTNPGNIVCTATITGP